MIKYFTLLIVIVFITINTADAQNLTQLQIYCPKLQGGRVLKNGDVFLGGTGFSGKLKTDQHGIITLSKKDEQALMNHNAIVYLYGRYDQLLAGCATLPFKVISNHLSMVTFDGSGLQLDCGAAYQCFT